METEKCATRGGGEEILNFSIKVVEMSGRAQDKERLSR